MAWIEQNHPDRPYQLVLRYADKRLKRSTKTKIESEAEEIRLRVERRLKLLEQGELTLPPDADLMSFLMQTTAAVSPPVMAQSVTLSRLAEDYLESLPEGALEENTLLTCRIHIGHLKAVMGANLRLRDLNQSDLQAYVNERAKQTGRAGAALSPRTIKKELATFSVLWKFAAQRGHVSQPFPNHGLKFPKEGQKSSFQTFAQIDGQIARQQLEEKDAAELWETLFLTAEETNSFLRSVQEHARHAFLYPMIATAAHTGARRSELLRSQTNDVDLESNVFMIREKKRKRGQQTFRQVPLSPLLREVLTHWLESHPGGRFTFCMVPGQVLTIDQAHHHFTWSLSGQWGKIRGWHTLRHSFASNCAAAGIDQRVINEWMGHQTEEMTKRYRHLFPDQQQAALSLVFGQ